MGGNWKKWGWDWWWSGCWEKGCTSQAGHCSDQSRPRQNNCYHCTVYVCPPLFQNLCQPLGHFLKITALQHENCGRSWPRGWLLIRFDFPHQRLQGGLGLGRNGLVDNDDNNQDLRPVLCLLRARPALSGLFVFFVWFLAKSLFVRDTQSGFWFVCFLLVNFSTLLLPNIMYIRQRQVGETIYNLLIRRYCEKE